MFETLSQKLSGAFRSLSGNARITEKNISEALGEIRSALIDADVHVSVVDTLITRIKEKALGVDVLKNIAPTQLIVKIIYDELVRLLGSDKSEIKFSATPPSVIMVVGLQGSGKTTFSAKLARFLVSKGKQPLLVAADTYRPAAVDQLQMLGASISVPVFTMAGETPLVIAKESLAQATRTARDVVIIDTAGRLSVDERMMAEVALIKDITHPSEILFVIDAMIGQSAVETAKAFHERLGYDGVVLTKLDGDARGGAALSVREVVHVPIKFSSVGEKLEALDEFYPERIASRILGMGDVVSLVEKAQAQFSEEESEKLENKLRKQEFTFDDFLDQLQTIKKMGSVRDLLAMLPGVNKSVMESVDEKAFHRVEAIIHSMTQYERRYPQLLNGSRRTRIARGSGTTIQDVNKLVKQFEEMKKMMKMMSKGNAGLKAMNQLMGTMK